MITTNMETSKMETVQTEDIVVADATPATKKKAAKTSKEKLVVTSLLKSLIQAQGEFPAIAKNHTNPFAKNKYADLSDIISTVRPVLNKHGIGLRHEITDADTSDTERVAIEAIIFNAEGEQLSSGEMIFSIGKGGNQFQTKGMALTYGRRYTLCSLLGIVADDDTDGETQRIASKDTSIAKDLRDRAFNASQGGMESYQAFYASLTNDERKQLVNSGLHESLKATCEMMKGNKVL